MYTSSVRLHTTKVTFSTLVADQSIVSLGPLALVSFWKLYAHRNGLSGPTVKCGGAVLGTSGPD